MASAGFTDPDSGNWEGGWEMDEQPDWIDLGQAGSVSTFSGGTLTMTDAADPWTAIWNANTDGVGNLTPLLGDPGPWGIEYRYRSSGSTTTKPLIFQAWYIGPPGTQWGQADFWSAVDAVGSHGNFYGRDSDGTTVKALALTVPDGHDWGEYHTYRLEGNIPTDSFGTATVIFSVDGEEQAEMDYYFGYDGTTTNVAGLVANPRGDGSVFVEFDYIRFTNVPEPATLGLLGLGGLLMLKRRRRYRQRHF